MKDSALRSFVPGEGLCRLLLRTYPEEFRKQFGDMMIDYYRQRVAQAALSSGIVATFAVQCCAYVSMIIGSLLEHAASPRSSGAVCTSD